MKKKSTPIIILFVILILSIVLRELGFTLISKIIAGLFTIAALLLSLPNIKAMNKKLLAFSITITGVPGIVSIYAMFFHADSLYWLFGSFVCFILGIIISIVTACVLFYRKGDKTNWINIYKSTIYIVESVKLLHI